MGVETELFGLKNRWDGKEFRVIERADGSIAVLAGEKVLVDSGVTPVTAVPSDGVLENSLGGVTVRRLQQPRNIGTKIFGGRMGTRDNSTPRTYHVLMSLAQHFDAVRVIFGNGSTGTAYNVAKLAVRGASDMSDINKSASSWTAGTFGGAANASVPVAGGAKRRGYKVSDWIEYNSLDRIDGGKYPLLLIRAYIDTAATINMFGNGSDDYTNWASKPDGRYHIMRSNAGDCVTTPASFTSTTNESQSPIIGVQYAARGRVVTVMLAGDSISEGAGATYRNETWGMKVAEAVSDKAGVAVECANIAYSGCTYTNVRDLVLDAFAAGIIPDILAVPNGSPNDISTTISAGNITANQSRLARILAACGENRVTPVVWTWLPSTTAVKAYGATDSLRTAWNTTVMGYRYRGIDVIDFAGVVGGVANGSGQIEPDAAKLPDGLHPNDVTNDALAAALTPLVKSYALSVI